MDPHIQYAKTSDGVNIAYATFGEGPPIVYLSGSLAGIHNYSHFPPARGHVDSLAAGGWKVIRYDGRGTGSSDRDAMDFSLEARVRDLEAVVERLELKRFVLIGRAQGGFAAIAYAAQNSERVSRLILVEPYASGALGPTDSAIGQALKAMRPLFGEHWDLMSLNVAYLVFGFREREDAESLAASYRSGFTGYAYRAVDEADEEIDVTGLLGSVSAPTFVVHDTSHLGRAFARGREGGASARNITAGVPNARLISTDNADSAIDSILSEASTETQTTPDLPSGTAIILFADIVDSTALTERLGDDAFRERARALDDAMRAAIRASKGTAIEGKLLGDGVLAVFTAARDAITAAIACRDASKDVGLELHLGLHAGDVIREDDNVHGGAVNIAARISGLSAPGEVLVSRTIADLARTSAGVSFEDRGEQALKGIEEPVRLFAVRQS